MKTRHPILKLEDLVIRYSRSATYFHKQEEVTAVRGVSFEIQRGETFAIVGESGCGKTSLAMSILGFVRPQAGSITFMDKNIWSLDRDSLRSMRRKIQPVFQDPHSSLNPRMTVRRAIEDALDPRTLNDLETVHERVVDTLRTVGLGSEHMNVYPHQLSGGQKQRVCLARALASEPEVLVLDEPLASQDLSIQAHLLHLLVNLKEEQKLTYLIISHDLRVVRAIAQRVAVMKEGRFVEISDRDQLFRSPQHPYTVSLLENMGGLHPPVQAGNHE